MISQEQIDDFLHRISQDEELGVLFKTPPEGTTVPFRQSPVDRHFATTFALRGSDITLENLASLCEAIVRRFVSDGLAVGLKAIGILVCAQTDNEIERVLRFSVLDETFHAIPRLSAGDILLNEPAPGIKCGWYWDRSKVPSK